MPRAFYNEIDPYAAQWLRNLIGAGLIADGDVDERSIVDITAHDLKGYTQCHFFAGIGGWSLALRLAGIPDSRPVWTGSCPCQPFSVAGKGKGTADERHLWPQFARLIDECRPATVFGEQVASAAGRSWCAGVRADLEVMGYAVGCADLCAAGIGAPHIRQRLWWVAHSRHEQCRRRHSVGSPAGSDGGTTRTDEGSGCAWRSETGQRAQHESTDGGASGWLVDTERQRRRERIAWREDAADVASASKDAWSGIYVGCADGRARRIEPCIEPLAHGVPARVGRLRAYGNAIVPQVAAEFVMAYEECL